MKRATGIALAGGLLILVAFAFDTSELFVPGIALAIVGILVPPWIWLALRGTSVRRSFDTEQVLENQPVEARIELCNGPLGAPGAEIIDPLAGGSIVLAGSMLALRRRSTADVRVVARFARRGRRTLEPPLLALRDPLGIMRLVRHGGGSPQTLLVLPRIERVRWARNDPGERLYRDAGAAPLETLAAIEVDGLRPYRPGTPASRISWPALARGAGLLERRMQVERDAGPLVVLDVRCSGSPERVDAAVRAAGSLAHELGRRTGCELLLPGDRRAVQIEPELSAWQDVHVRLALVEGGPETAAPSLSGRPRSGIIFYVAAQHEQLPPQLMRAGNWGVVLVLPNEVRPPVSGSAQLEVSGCSGYVLGAAGRLSPRERAA